MSLNTHSPIPLYRQLAQRLRGHIERGDIAVSQKIPSENELATEYGIGRPTVRQATDLLVREGVLQRRRGAGTFVLPPSRRIDLFSLAGTSSALKELAVPVQIELLREQERITGPDFLPDSLIGKPVYKVDRLSRIDHEPVLLELFYLNAEIFDGLERFDLQNTSLSKVVREHYYLEASSADQEFVITHIDSEKAGLFGLAAGLPLLKVARRLHFNEYKDAIYVEIYCRTDRYRFSQTITTSDLLIKEADYAE